jgi:hypothetical protein
MGREQSGDPHFGPGAIRIDFFAHKCPGAAHKNAATKVSCAPLPLTCQKIVPTKSFNRLPPLRLIARFSNLRAATVVETFGSGPNAFSIAFVDIGNAGNADDAGSGGGSSSPYGALSDNYRIGVSEVPQAGFTAGSSAFCH